MSFRYALVCTLLVAAMAVTVAAEGKTPSIPMPARHVTLTTLQPRQALLSPSAAAACTTASIGEVIYRMDGWVTGNELYKAYIDPAAQCPAPYPYTITAVNMPMYFAKAAQLDVSVDIEEVQMVNGNCTAPGNIMAISTDYTLTVPAAGYYALWLPLDTPVVVTGPFFAGFFISSIVDAGVGAAVLIDSFPTHCRTYNAWDTALGFVDLTNFPPQFGTDWNWPGKLAMEVAGIPGGEGGTQPEPQAKWLSPAASTTLYGMTDLWGAEASGSNIIEYVSFTFFNVFGWSEMGRDYDGTRALRDGVNATAPADGYAFEWDFSMMEEKDYTLRVTAYDTLGRSSSTTAIVTLEPTPPRPRITSPANGSGFCTPLLLLMQCGDENMQSVQVYRKDASAGYSAGVTTLHQQALGNVNGDPTDGNHATQGEFGDFYCGPAAAAVAVKLWTDRGYAALMQSGGSSMSLPQVAEELAAAFKTRTHSGTFDEDLYAGLQTYLASHGNEIDIDFLRHPDYWQLRTWAEEEERAVLLGLGGTPGFWVTVDGFSGWQQLDGTYQVAISNPLTGTIQTVKYRETFGTHELYVNGVWHRIDIAVSLVAKNWTPVRMLVGIDATDDDGWWVNWTATGLVEDGLYFFKAVGTDSTNHSASSTVLLRYNCADIFAAGDYDGDTNTDINDLTRLINYLAKKGPAPIGGVGRADANCDNIVNLADVIYYMNFLSGQAGTPCY